MELNCVAEPSAPALVDIPVRFTGAPPVPPDVEIQAAVQPEGQFTSAARTLISWIYEAHICPALAKASTDDILAFVNKNWNAFVQQVGTAGDMLERAMAEESAFQNADDAWKRFVEKLAQQIAIRYGDLEGRSIRDMCEMFDSLIADAQRLNQLEAAPDRDAEMHLVGRYNHAWNVGLFALMALRVIFLDHGRYAAAGAPALMFAWLRWAAPEARSALTAAHQLRVSAQLRILRAMGHVPDHRGDEYRDPSASWSSPEVIQFEEEESVREE